MYWVQTRVLFKAGHKLYKDQSKGFGRVWIEALDENGQHVHTPNDFLAIYETQENTGIDLKEGHFVAAAPADAAGGSSN